MGIMNPKLFIGMILAFTLLMGFVVIEFLAVDIFMVGFFLASVYLVITWFFNWVVLGGAYSNVWNLFWRKGDGWGFVTRKWIDGFYNTKVEQLPKDRKVNFAYKNAKGEKIVDTVFVSHVEYDQKNKCGHIIAKQGLTETINLSATDHCKLCGYVPYEAEGTAQLINDYAIIKETKGKLSVLDKKFGHEKPAVSFWQIAAIVLLIVAILIIALNNQEIITLQETVAALKGTVPAAGNVVITPGN